MSMSVANDGTLVYAVNPVEQARLLLLNRQGELVGVAGAPQAGMGRPEFSPDGRRVAVWGFEYETAWDIWVHEVDRPLKTRLSRNDGMDIQPVWSPDGTRIAFTSDRAGGTGPRATRDLYVRPVDRNEEAVLVARDAFVWDWSENGAYLLATLRQNEKQQGGDLGYLEIKGQPPYEVKPLRTTQYEESHAVFSPDSRYAAFVSNDTGTPEVYVCSFPDCLEEKRVSTKGGAFPHWARKQGSLYYLQDEDTLMEVKITTQPDLDIGKLQPLFTHPSLAFPGFTDTRKYDVSEDGERFIVVENGMERISKENPAVIHVWRNWYAGFKDRQH
jgi:Tol biopolymer transport system component